MRATRFNHVSVHATDMEESLRFYTELFGMERIPSPTFRHRVEWLRLGEQQLHLFLRETAAPPYHHIGLDVDDFEAFYTKAKELRLLDPETWFSPVYELPDGAVQMYIRDPAGNLVEIDWPDVSTLDRSVVTDIRRLADEVPQDEESLRATLYHAVLEASGQTGS
jgi:YD repeat-containing protein